MSREIAASHDPAVLSCLHLGAALVVHRAAPALSLVELLERAARSGPASRAIKHARGCGDCRIDTLCPPGAGLVRTIGHRGPRRRRAA